MMPTDNEVQGTPESEVNANPTHETGLSSSEATDLLLSQNDPNAADMDNNGDGALLRQLTGELPGSASEENPNGLPSAQSDAFEEGT